MHKYTGKQFLTRSLAQKQAHRDSNVQWRPYPHSLTHTMTQMHSCIQTLSLAHKHCLMETHTVTQMHRCAHSDTNAVAPKNTITHCLTYTATQVHTHTHTTHSHTVSDKSTPLTISFGAFPVSLGGGLLEGDGIDLLLPLHQGVAVRQKRLPLVTAVGRQPARQVLVQVVQPVET